MSRNGVGTCWLTTRIISSGVTPLAHMRGDERAGRGADVDVELVDGAVDRQEVERAQRADLVDGAGEAAAAEHERGLRAPRPPPRPAPRASSAGPGRARRPCPRDAVYAARTRRRDFRRHRGVMTVVRLRPAAAPRRSARAAPARRRRPRARPRRRPACAPARRARRAWRAPSAAPTPATSTPGATLVAVRADVAADPGLGREALRHRDGAAALRPGRRARHERRSPAPVDAEGALRGRPLARRRRRPDARPRPTCAAWPPRCAAAGIARVEGGVVGDDSALRPAAAAAPRTGFALDRDLGGAPRRAGPRAAASSPTRRRYAAAPLRRRACARRGRRRSGPHARAGGAPDGRRPSSPTIGSPPIARPHPRARTCPSDNFLAEMLLKALGARVRRRRARPRAGAARRARARSTTSACARGSSTAPGLARANRTTPRQVVRLLERMDGQEVARDVPLVARRRRPHRHGPRAACAAPPPQGRCRVKTGTIRGVSNLAGVLHDAPAAATVAFAWLMNGVERLGARAHPGPDDGAARALRDSGLQGRRAARAARPRRAPGTPRRSAFSSLEPGDSPATT